MCKRNLVPGDKCRKMNIFEDYCRFHIPREATIECCICYAEVKWDKILKCKHPICDRCLNKLRDDKCPICRGKLEGRRIRPFLLEKIRSRKTQDKKERELEISLDLFADVYFQVIDQIDSSEED
jgi:hypothetical protein